MLVFFSLTCHTFLMDMSFCPFQISFIWSRLPVFFFVFPTTYRSTIDEKNRSIEHLNDMKPKEHTMSSVEYPVGQVKTTWTSKSFMSPG